MSVVETLSATPIFRGVEREVLETLANAAIERSYERGQIVCRQDEHKPGIFILLSGSARALVVGENGREVVTRLFAPGETFADVATVGGIACPSSVEIIRPARCLFLPADAVDTFLETNATACHAVLRNVAAVTDRLVRRLAQSTTHDADARVAAFLKRHDGDVRWGKRNVALFLGISSETFSRVLRRLADAELIDADVEGPVRILDAEALEQVAAGRRSIRPVDA